jgi:solute carrier family 25 aspartate/glutamate transporter 12/13
MATVTEQVGEVLLGTTDAPQLSGLMRQTFFKHAKKDDKDEYVLEEKDFIDAVAPESEDYVNIPPATCRLHWS